MSVLLVENTDFSPLKLVLETLGCKHVFKCSADSITVKTELPQEISCIVMVSQDVSNEAKENLQKLAKSKKLPLIHTRKDASSVFYEWTKTFGEPTN